jgi:hypothetical protein
MTHDIEDPSRRPQALPSSPLTAPLRAGIPGNELQPVFIRLPKTGHRCRWTGLSRTVINELILGSRPRVKSVVLRKRGAIRGVRLIHLESLLAHLHAEMVRQIEAAPIDERADHE